MSVCTSVLQSNVLLRGSLIHPIANFGYLQLVVMVIWKSSDGLLGSASTTLVDNVSHHGSEDGDNRQHCQTSNDEDGDFHKVEMRHMGCDFVD